MQTTLQQTSKQQKQLEKINQQFSLRAAKFGSEFVPMTLNDYKMFKIQKAKQTGNIKYLQNMLFEDVTDLKQKKQIITNRIKRFYPDVKVQETNKFFQKRQDPDLTKPQIQPRPNAWHLFGVDYMSNDVIRMYFHPYSNFKIQWINDSSCNIVFNNEEDALQALRPKITGQGIKDQNDVWFQLPQYETEGIKRKLVCRLATTGDKKKQNLHGHDSKYYQWKINKDKLGSFVKKAANYEIKKTKFINREDKYHNKQSKKIKQKKQQEQDSSSLESIMKQQQ